MLWLRSLLALGILCSGLFANSPLSNSFKSPFLIKKLDQAEINSWYFLYLKKALEQARELEADLIILELDTPGGEVQTALKMVNHLMEAEATLVVYINENAISAGALISLAGDKIFINDGGVIGASTPVYAQGTEMKKAPEKVNSVLRSKFRSLAEKHGRPIRVCEAMVDDEIVLTEKDDGYDLPKGKLLTLTQKEALLLGVADHPASRLSDVYQKLALETEDVKQFEISSSLKILDFLSHPFLLTLFMMVGFWGLLSEARTPGWGIGGTVAVMALTAFFVIQILVNNADWKIPLVFFVGVTLLVMEFFVIPGFGVVGIAGFLAILASIFFSFGIENWQTALGTTTAALIGLLVFTIMSIRFFPDSNIFHRVSLEAVVEGVAGGKAVPIKTGDLGEVISDLRPFGKARFEKGIYEVVAEGGGYIDSGSKIRVLQIQPENKVVVQSAT